MSDRITWEDSVWIFTSSVPFAEEQPGPFGECSTESEAAAGPGSTGCEVRSDAESERAAMIVEGWECGPVALNEASGMWEFDWELKPNARI